MIHFFSNSVDKHYSSKWAGEEMTWPPKDLIKGEFLVVYCCITKQIPKLSGLNWQSLMILWVNCLQLFSSRTLLCGCSQMVTGAGHCRLLHSHVRLLAGRAETAWPPTMQPLHLVDLVFLIAYSLSKGRFFKHFIYLFIFGCVGSSFLCAGFLQL